MLSILLRVVTRFAPLWRRNLTAWLCMAWPDVMGVYVFHALFLVCAYETFLISQSLLFYGHTGHSMVTQVSQQYGYVWQSQQWLCVYRAFCF